MPDNAWLAARRERLHPTESLGPLVAGSVLVIAVVYDAFLDPVHGPVTCPLLALTGVPCPACGLTRSFVALGDGRWADAWAAHPLGPVLALALAATFLTWAWRLVRNQPPRAGKRVRWAWWALAGAFLVFGLGRATLGG